MQPTVAICAFDVLGSVVYYVFTCKHLVFVSFSMFQKAQKAEREATDLKGTMRKRMEFLDMD